MDFCLGESKRLFDKSRYGNFSCLCCYVDFAEFWIKWLYKGYDGKFRGKYWPSSCAGAGACRFGVTSIVFIRSFLSSSAREAIIAGTEQGNGNVVD